MNLILKILLYSILALFLAKVAFNLAVPYVLLRRLRGLSGKPEQRTGGISLMPAVELVLFAALVAVSALIDEDGFFYGGGSVAMFGGACIAVSYLHLAVVGFVGGRLVSRSDRSGD